MRGIQTLTMFFVIIIFSQCSYFTEMQKQREKVYNDLKTLCDSLPIPEGFRKTDSQDLIKPDRGSVTNNFKTNLDCKDAERPYYEYITLQGWLPTANGSSYYYKDNYIIDVTCKNGFSQSDEKTIQVSCGWDEYGEKKEVFK